MPCNVKPISLKRYRAASGTTARPKIVPTRRRGTRTPGPSSCGHRPSVCRRRTPDRTRPSIDRTAPPPTVNYIFGNITLLRLLHGPPSTGHHYLISVTQNGYFARHSAILCASVVFAVGFRQRGVPKAARSCRSYQETVS